MITPKIMASSVIVVWLIMAALVMGYPLITGRIRAGLRTVDRNNDPAAFCKAYALSTVLFIGMSALIGTFMHLMLH